MPTYLTKAATGVKPIVLPDTAQATPVVIDIEFATVAPLVNDLYEIAELPAQLAVLDFAFILPSLAASGLAWSFGVLNPGGTDLAEVWASGLSAGVGSTITRATTAVAAQSSAAAPRKIALKCTTAPVSWTGNKVGQVVLTARG